MTYSSRRPPRPQLPTTYFAPVSPGVDAVVAPASRASPSSSSPRPSSKPSSPGRSMRPERPLHDPSTPIPTGSSFDQKTQVQTFPSGTFVPPSTSNFVFMGGYSGPNMYDSSASLSASEVDEGVSDDGEAKRERRSNASTRRRRRGEVGQPESAPTTPSTSLSSAPRERKSKEHLRRAERGVNGHGKAAAMFPGDRGLGVEIEGIGWDYGAAERARSLNEAHQKPTYSSDLGSGISTQNSSPEIASNPDAPTSIASAAAPPTSPSRPLNDRPPRPSRSRPISTSGRSELEGQQKRAPRFLDEQVVNHERRSVTVELHPDHIDFSAVTPASSRRTSNSPSRRASIGSTLRTPSLVHSPSSNGHDHASDTPPLPTSSVHFHQQQQPTRTKSISSVASTRSRSSTHHAHSTTVGQPTPKALVSSQNNTYFPPPPPKSSRRPSSNPPAVTEEDWGTSSSPQIFPSHSQRIRQSPSPALSTGPFPGPPARPRSEARSPNTDVFPTTASRPPPRMPTPRHGPQVFPISTSSPSLSPAPSLVAFPSTRSPRSAESSPRAQSLGGRRRGAAPWEMEGEDELDWMVGAQRKLEPKPKVQRERSGRRKSGAGGARRPKEDESDDEMIDLKELMVEEELEEKFGLQRTTPTKLSTALRDVAAEHPSPIVTTLRSPHQRHRQHLSSISSTATGASEYASAEEEPPRPADEDDIPLAHFFTSSHHPIDREQLPIFPPAVPRAHPQQPGEQDLWVLEGISNAAVGENSRRMSAIGEESEVEEERKAGRLNKKRLSLVSRNGEPTPTTTAAVTPTRPQQSQPTTPPQQFRALPLSTPGLLRSPVPTSPSPSRPAPPRSQSHPHSMYALSNSSTLSAQTSYSPSIASTTRSGGKRRLSKKLGAFFGSNGGDEQPMEKGISSEHMKAWAALQGEEQSGDFEEEKEHEKEKDVQVIRLESMLESFKREEQERLKQLKATKWGAAAVSVEQQQRAQASV